MTVQQNCESVCKRLYRDWSELSLCLLNSYYLCCEMWGRRNEVTSGWTQSVPAANSSLQISDWCQHKKCRWFSKQTFTFSPLCAENELRQSGCLYLSEASSANSPCADVRDSISFVLNIPYIDETVSDASFIVFCLFSICALGLKMIWMYHVCICLRK